MSLIKPVLFSFFFFITSVMIFAQISTQEIPYSIREEIAWSSLDALMVSFEEDIINPEDQNSVFPQFAGVSIPVSARFSSHASRTITKSNQTLWRMKIHVPDAAETGIVFSGLHMKKGDELYIYDHQGKYHLGAFTEQNNSPSGILSTHILPATTLIVEYLPGDSSTLEVPDFTIEEIIYIIRSPLKRDNKSSGPCNVNINCPEGDLWQKQKRGVARLLLKQGSSWFNCSGSLVNNTAQDGHPYFLTSDHCGSSASEADLEQWQFYFNYEYAGCLNSGGAPQNMMLTGASVIANAPLQQGTDFKLLELNTPPPGNWNPYFNGWTLASRSPESGVGIHHPSGDAKKISSYFNPLGSSTFTGGMTMGYWRVVWEETPSGHGVTEGGSSGSPVFEENGLITGTLTGGSASCSNPTQPDYYGKFYLHWQANGSEIQKRLQPWLDPLDENPEQLFGYDPNAITNFVVVDVIPPNAGSVMGAGYYAENEEVALSAHANQGFTFTKWTDEQGEIITTDSFYSFTMPQTSINIAANFTQVENHARLDAIAENIVIFPNPASGRVEISFGIAPAGFVDLSVYNSNGRKVMHDQLTTVDKERHMLDISTLTTGVYMVFLDYEDLRITKKLIILP